MNYKIPLFDLNFDHREEDAVLDTLRSRWISTGPKCLELEKLFSQMFDCKHAVTLNNCTSSLHLALKVLDIGKGDEVIVPSLTFSATVNAVRYVNAKPVFCDISGTDDLTISTDQISKLITPNTKAVIVMHYAGFSCDMDSIMKIANEHGVYVIEDACHGPLSEYKGKKLGTIGHIGCFSFFSNKNISTGEGGMLITNDDDIFENSRLLRSHGMTSLSFSRAKGHVTEYDVVNIGYNYRLDDIRASIGIVQLKKLSADIKKRREIRFQYIERLNGIAEQIVIPFKDNTDKSSNYIFPIILKDSTREFRDQIRQKLKDDGVQTSIHYPPVHLFSVYQRFSTSLPVTEYVAANEITLPMYSKLTNDQIDYICNKLSGAIKSS